jgi:hypothetical protein
MSMRPAEELPMQQQTAASAMRLRANIDQARAVQSPVAETAATAAPVEGALTFDDLTETEKSAASIGVSPDEWKPIGFMNAHHYSTLLKNNAIAGDLAQGIEAYKQVAGGLSPVA